MGVVRLGGFDGNGKLPRAVVAAADNHAGTVTWSEKAQHDRIVTGGECRCCQIGIDDNEFTGLPIGNWVVAPWWVGPFTDFGAIGIKQMHK